MQALTGLWAQQFGTPDWAATAVSARSTWPHGSINSIGYSFWEFGSARLGPREVFRALGVAEDHSSNLIKIGLDKLKTHSAKFVSINPVRTGWCYYCG